MFLSMKFLSIFFLIFSVIGGVLSSSALSLWFFLELSTVSFLLNLMFTKHSAMFKETMKLFLIQALSGMSILLLLLVSESSTTYTLDLFIWLVVLFKMSAIPFHSWFLNLSNKMSWESMLLFLTVMKFIPLMVLAMCSGWNSEFFSLLSFIVASISSLFYSSIKKLMVFSSLYFLGMLFFSMNFTNIWFEMMAVYMTMFLPLFFVFSNLNNILFLEDWFKGLSTFVMFMFIISLAGLPPFPGFFLKYFWLVELKIDFTSLVIFFLSSSLMVYLYVSFTMKNLLETFNQLWVPGNVVKMNFFQMWFFLIPAYISIYFCF